MLVVLQACGLYNGRIRQIHFPFIMNLEQRKASMVYEIASLINDDPLSAPILIEELIEIMSDEQIDHIEDVIVNHFGVEVYPE